MGTHNILWIDDQIEMLKSHVIFLAEKGYDVETVTNGEDAIDLVEEKNFSLIFLDEMMPGMGGLETLAKIKEIDPNIFTTTKDTKGHEKILVFDFSHPLLSHSMRKSKGIQLWVVLRRYCACIALIFRALSCLS